MRTHFHFDFPSVCDYKNKIFRRKKYINKIEEKKFFIEFFLAIFQLQKQKKKTQKKVLNKIIYSLRYFFFIGGGGSVRGLSEGSFFCEFK